MSYWLFLDDERWPPKDWGDKEVFTIARSFDRFVHKIKTYGLPSFISFDHDLGEGKNGYDCAHWLIDHLMDNGIKEPVNFYVHSQNPVGAKNIRRLLRNYNRELKRGTLDAGKSD